MYLRIKSFLPVEIKTKLNFHSYMPFDIGFENENIISEKEELYCLSMQSGEALVEIFLFKKSKLIESIVFKDIGELLIVDDSIPLSNSGIFLTPCLDTGLIWEELPEEDYHIRIEQEILIIKGERDLQFKWGDTVKSFNINGSIGFSLNKANDITAITLYNLQEKEMRNILSFN